MEPEKNEWVLGRDTGHFKFDNASVSSTHAKLSRDKAGAFWIEDLESSNGTFVNGERVLRKKVKASDKIRLGKHEIDLNDIARKLPISNIEMINGFNDLKDVYEKYEEIKEAAEAPELGKEILVRAMGSGPGMLIMGGSFLVGPEAANMIRIVGIIAMVAGIFLAPFLTNSGKKEKSQKLKEIKLWFMQSYICPNPECKRHFGDIPWTILQQQGKCLFCKRNFVMN